MTSLDFNDTNTSEWEMSNSFGKYYCFHFSMENELFRRKFEFKIEKDIQKDLMLDVLLIFQWENIRYDNRTRTTFFTTPKTMATFGWSVVCMQIDSTWENFQNDSTFKWFIIVRFVILVLFIERWFFIVILSYKIHTHTHRGKCAHENGLVIRQIFFGENFLIIYCILNVYDATSTKARKSRRTSEKWFQPKRGKVLLLRHVKYAHVNRCDELTTIEHTNRMARCFGIRLVCCVRVPCVQIQNRCFRCCIVLSCTAVLSFLPIFVSFSSTSGWRWLFIGRIRKLIYSICL